MKIEILGDCRWSINFVGVDFKAGQICDIPGDVPVDIANDMIRHGHAREYALKAENKQVEYGQGVSEKADVPEKKQKGKK